MTTQDDERRKFGASATDTPALVVGPGAVLRPTPEEALVLATGTVQRMARLRQTGLGYLAAPCSEHTRLAHCLGTTYWVTEIFRRLHSNARTEVGTRAGGQQSWLAGMDARLGCEGMTERLARLFALIHDCSLLPLGHTIKHQLGFTHDKTSVLGLLLNRISRLREECREAAASMIADQAQKAALVATVDRDLALLEWVVAATQLIAGKPCDYVINERERARFLSVLPALSFISEVVTGPLSADIFDYAVRDLSTVNVAYQPAPVLLESLRVIAWRGDDLAAGAIRRHLNVEACPPLFRLALTTARGPLSTEALHALLEARYLIAERLFFNPSKLAADAMLDLALRRIDALGGEVSSFTGSFAPQRLLAIGDDAFLDLLLRREADAARGPGRPVVAELVKRRLFTALCRVGPAAREGDGRTAARQAMRPAERNRVERMLREHVGVTEDAMLCFSCAPADMQFKAADILIVDARGEAAVLEEIAPKVEGLAAIAALRDRYADLWSAAILCPASAATPALAAKAIDFLTRYFGSAAMGAS